MRCCSDAAGVLRPRPRSSRSIADRSANSGPPARVRRVSAALPHRAAQDHNHGRLWPPRPVDPAAREPKSAGSRDLARSCVARSHSGCRGSGLHSDVGTLVTSLSSRKQRHATRFERTGPRRETVVTTGRLSRRDTATRDPDSGERDHAAETVVTTGRLSRRDTATRDPDSGNRDHAAETVVTTGRLSRRDTATRDPDSGERDRAAETVVTTGRLSRRETATRDPDSGERDHAAETVVTTGRINQRDTATRDPDFPPRTPATLRHPATPRDHAPGAPAQYR
ncbi:hypothetical protein BKA10_001531 [Microbacterium invictum]|uniref:Uncharacterized protein n=1 Tax=Microbacterium invictum TaxID=515415 RepID=A0AA40SP89_9MICO|nr:hypothetical protein [Microbacterium invictum]